MYQLLLTRIIEKDVKATVVYNENEINISCPEVNYFRFLQSSAPAVDVRSY